MKKAACLLALVIIAVGVICGIAGNTDNNDYIRIHIRANSNSDYDQAIKYKVKDSVVEALIPLSKDMNSKTEMYQILENNLEFIRKTVDKRLAELGQKYTSRVRLNKEEFPTRSYEDLTLQAGVYDALIIELGTGTGDNWWCVAFPPLCFTGTDNGSGRLSYKSKIAEFFDSILK